MLVEINLLPKKEPKKYGFIILTSLSVILILLAAGFYYYQIHTTNLKIQNVDKQMSILRKISDQQSEKLNKNQKINSASQLQNGVEWADEYRIQTIPVMKHLISLLPERGFIQTFNYTETGVVALTVQFDTTREAAYYIDRLNHSKWIEEAKINSLTTNTNENAGDSTNSSNVPSNTNLNNLPNTSNQNANSNINSDETTTKSGTEVVPRYIGQIEITLDKTMVKKFIKDMKKNGSIEEGETQP
jgi:hypothetical protein